MRSGGIIKRRTRGEREREREREREGCALIIYNKLKHI